MTDSVEWLVAILAVAAITSGTWVVARSTVAIECERLGAFYVWSKTFECKEKK